jgi:hypothetical protein
MTYLLTVGCSWTVTPLSYTDEYVVTLESTFESYVPIPVITVSPMQLDMEILEEGLLTVITFEITNHGFIAAKNFTFLLPSDTHPFMHLQMVWMLKVSTLVFIICQRRGSWRCCNGHSSSYGEGTKIGLSQTLNLFTLNK